MSHTYFLIKFIVELLFGVEAADWPLMRDGLALNYIQIGLVLNSLSGVSGKIIPFGIGLAA